MRFDKLTTKFQQALADAQSAALANDNGFIEPVHLLSALLAQEDGGTASLLARAGVAVPRLQAALKAAIGRLPKVEGTGGEITLSRELNSLLNLTDKEASKRGDQFIASELFLLAAADDKGETGRLLREAGVNRKALESAIEAVRGQARPGDRPRRRDPPHDPDPAAAHQEQPGADRRAWRRQDGDRRGTRAAHRQRRGAGVAQEQARALARHGGDARGGEVPRRVRGAVEGRAEGHRRRRRAHDRVHRRAAHDGRRRQGRGRDRRRQHAEARARARRAALRGRDHPRRVPEVRREGRGARAALPEGPGRRAVGRGDDRDPARPAGALRDPPRRGHHRPGDRRGGGALAPLHHRPLPTRQGDRPGRRGRGADQDGDRQQARVDGQARPAADPVEDRARGCAQGDGRGVEEAPRRDRGRDRAARARVRGPRGGLEGGEGQRRRHAAHQGGDRQGQAAHGGGAAQGRLADDVGAPVRPAAAARGSAQEGRRGREHGEAEARPHRGRGRGDRRGGLARRPASRCRR